MMKLLQKVPDFKSDEEISAFMETHDGFELVGSGVCDSLSDAVNKAVHSYVLAVLPQSYKLVREK